MCTLREDLCTFMILSRSVLLRMRTISATRCRETQNTHFMFLKIPPPPPENRAVYEIMRDNRLEQATYDNIIRFMRFACWITKVTNTHPEYVIITVFPLQQLLHERASVIHYTCTYIACLVLFSPYISNCKTVLSGT